MNITKIEITTASYKTTNPPISERSSISALNGPCGAELVFEGSCNDSEYCRRYHLSAELFQQLVQQFEALQIKTAMLEKLEQPPQPRLDMVGGSQSGTVSFSANGVTVTADSDGINTAPLVAKMRELEQQCGEPYVNTSSGGSSVPFRMGIGVAAAPPARVCPNCGKPSTFGDFCSDCGTKLE